MMSFMRLNATKVLLVVLVSWMLAVLQPCCELIAATLPHDHGLTHEAHQSHQEQSTTQSGVVTDHQHCHTADTDIGEISVLVSDKLQFNNPKPKSDVVAVIGIYPGEHLVPHKLGISMFLHPPPGRHNRIYLQTQRFRI